MKVFLISICACLAMVGCSKEVEQQKETPKVIVQEAPPPPPPPAVTNPFDHPAPPPPAPAHPATQAPHWEQVGGEFKMNDNWSLWTWRDSANHNTCYFYTAAGNANGMSCVKE